MRSKRGRERHTAAANDTQTRTANATLAVSDLLVGRVVLGPRMGYVVVDSKAYKGEVQVHPRDLNGARHGEKVVVEITSWKRHSRRPNGIVREVLGAAGENEVEMHSILAEFGLPYRYDEALEQEADLINDDIESEIVKRLDLRDVVTFTIDPEDAKDFDDALSIRLLNTEDTELNTEGTELRHEWEVGVHIADVTHYVQSDSALDKEAYRRATSVYLVDRTIPMLPERLSNGICSLRPNEDKLTFSVLFRLDEDARVLGYKIKRTVIRSNRRFTYAEAQERIMTGQGDYAAELGVLNRLASRLRERRFAAGAIAFERQEVKVIVDKDGKPLDVVARESVEANWLIEEFMLLANRTVAEEVGLKMKQDDLRERAFVYRVHDKPDEDKMKDFARLVRQFGYTYKSGKQGKQEQKQLNSLLHDIKGKAEQNLIELLAVRSMAKAEYSTKNIGHYGLAFRHYTHFTSPIRRYPDMMVHRLLEKYLKGGKSVSADELEERCKHCSEMEQLAAQAERQSIKYKQVEFMAGKIGTVEEGIVSGVTEWGLYVELLDSHCEGLVPMRSLRGEDYFIFNEEEFCIEGMQTGVVYRLGDRVRVRVEEADIQKRQLDFVMV